jgi:hypothetical protein
MSDAHVSGGGRAALAIAIAFALASAAAWAEAPAAPQMPSHWHVAYDFEVPPDQVAAIEAKLGAEISALRNTAYDVRGKRVRINTIVAPDVESADALMRGLLRMKSELALLRKGLLIYEFVGTNDVLPEIREGRAHIASGT